MKYKLVNVIREVEEDVMFGTCEVCEHMGTLHYDILVFEDEEGNMLKEENGRWSWGDWIESWWIDNYVDFAGFISGREYPVPDRDEYGVGKFYEIINLMYQDYSEYEYERDLNDN